MLSNKNSILFSLALEDLCNYVSYIYISNFIVIITDAITSSNFIYLLRRTYFEAGFSEFEVHNYSYVLE